MMTTGRAIELLETGSRFPNTPHTMAEMDEACNLACHAIRRTAEYDMAVREGRMVLLPCKVGDVVYVAFRSHGIFEIGVRKVTGFTDKAIEFSNQGFRLFTDFGKTVFFSRAEAEAALGDERDE